MTTENALPAFGDCIDLYLTAYDQFGTDPFTRDQIEVAAGDCELRYLLDLSVAYGLLQFDGRAYRVRFDPDVSAERWHDWATNRARSVYDAIADWTTVDGRGESGKPNVEPERLVHDGTAFVSVSVDETDDFESLVDNVAIIADAEGCNGVVLRSEGELANHVQRLADRLSDPEAIAETELSRPLHKEYTDVVGRNKDELEFRLYLARA